MYDVIIILPMKDKITKKYYTITDRKKIIKYITMFVNYLLTILAFVVVL